MLLAHGEEFAGYRIEAVVGKGGMGTVYRAQQLRPRRSVALKIVSSEYSSDTQFRTRFAREAELAAAIEHPCVVPIYEVGEHEGHLFIAMRFVDGTDLGTLLESGPLAPSRAVAIIERLATALNAAHQLGLVHRDIKPANVLIRRTADEEHVYLTDFGIARRVVDTAGLTDSGMFVGTPGFAAPEQIRGLAPDTRTDVYALGCVLYAALTGQTPLRKTDDLATLWAHAHENPPAPSQLVSNLDPRFDEVVAMAMAKDPDQRFASATALARAAAAALQAQAQQLKCPSCLAPVAPGLQFCTHCGAAATGSPRAATTQAPLLAPVAQPAPAATHAAPVAAMPTHRLHDAPARETRARAGVPPLALAAIALLAAAIVAGALLLRDNQGTSTTQASAGLTTPVASSGSSGTRQADADAPPKGHPSQRKRSRRRAQTAPPAATSAPTEPAPQPTEAAPVPEVETERIIAFQTGTDAGKDLPAAYCQMSRAQLYCWTPNDGYTLRLTGSGVERVSADEPGNEGRVPGGYDLLGEEETAEGFGYSCTNRVSGLSCNSTSGHGWTLPRYVGLPTIY
jgi:predicted Ser/Thr protein kinase